MSNGRIVSLSSGQTQIIPNIVQNKILGTQQGTLTVAVTSGAPTNIVGANLVLNSQIHRQTSVSTAGIIIIIFCLMVLLFFIYYLLYK